MDISVEKPDDQPSSDQLAQSWSNALHTAVCEHCDWTFLVSQDLSELRCPHCFKANLAPVKQTAGNLPYTQPPELVTPFSLAANTLDESIQRFAGRIPFAPRDLTGPQLRRRLRRVFLPMWLVDADIQAAWKAETGFNYQVVSHQSSYEQNRNAWATLEVKETRVRWEPRLGRLKRSYENVSSPALEDHQRILKQIGQYDLRQSHAYQAEDVQDVFVRLPDRSPEDAWGEAQPSFHAAAAEECRQAAGADAIRQFTWQPEYERQNWTLLLLPLYTSYYLDDMKTPNPVLIHGQTGAIYGRRRASLKRAQMSSLVLVIAAVIFFLVGLGLSIASLAISQTLIFGIIGVLIAFLLGAGAVIPVATVWWFNRHQVDSEG